MKDDEGTDLATQPAEEGDGQSAEREICGMPRFAGGWGSVCHQPKGHRPPHIFECGGDDDE